MDPEEPCYCEHERKWHDACSQCDCPWYLSPENEGARKRWRADQRARKRREAN